MPHNSLFYYPSENRPLDTESHSIPSCECLPREKKKKKGSVTSPCQDLKICHAIAGTISGKITCTVLER